MTRRLQPVEPLDDGNVRIYTCGPTVYARAHIGNLHARAQVHRLDEFARLL